MRYVALFLVLCALLLYGCGNGNYDTTTQRLDALEAAIAVSEETIEGLDDDVGELQAVIVQAQAALSDANIDAELKEKIQEVLDDAEEGLEVALSKRLELQVSVARWKEKLIDIRTDEEGIGQELQVYGEGLKAVAPMIPASVGPWVGVAGTLVALAGSVVISIKKRIKDKNIRTDLVTSVDSLLRTMDGPAVDAAKKILADAQSPETRAEVMKVHAA